MKSQKYDKTKINIKIKKLAKIDSIPININVTIIEFYRNILI